MAITWDSGNCSASLTLSGGNLTATCSASHSANVVRATQSQTTGKFYLEYTHNATVGEGDVAMGICNASQGTVGNTTVYLGSGNPSNATGNYEGAVYINGGAHFSLTNGGTGFVQAMAVDFGHQKIWWGSNASGAFQWNSDVLANQNPATNTGGCDYSAGGQPLSGFGTGTAFFPATDLETSTRTLTVNFGGSTYNYTTQSAAVAAGGFLNWDGSSIGGGGGGVVAPHSTALPKIMRRRTWIKGYRFPKKTVPLAFPLKVGLKTPLPKAKKTRPFFKMVYRPKDRFPIMYVKGIIVPVTVITNPPWNYGSAPLGGGPYGAANYKIIYNLQPNVPAAEPEKRDRKETYFKGRKLFSRKFAPKKWNVLGQHATPVHPPIAAGLRNPLRKVFRKHGPLKIKIIHRWPLPQFAKVHWTVAWQYGAGPYGGGLYGGAGQLFVIGPIIPRPVQLGALFWGYGGNPLGGGPYSSAGQDLAPPRQLYPLQGSVVPAAGPIRVADPYVSVVRSTTPPLAQTRKATPGLQQVRVNPPKLNK